MATRQTRKSDKAQANAAQAEAETPATPKKATRAKSERAPKAQQDGAAPKQTRAKKVGAQNESSAKNVTRSSGDVRQEDIARRAYELYQQRGGQDGSHEDDWFRAEQELRNGSR